MYFLDLSEYVLEKKTRPFSKGHRLNVWVLLVFSDGEICRAAGTVVLGRLSSSSGITGTKTSRLCAAFLWIQVIMDANVYLLEETHIWKECLWTPGCGECEGIRVLSGFEIYPGGNGGRLKPDPRGLKRNRGADECLKGWQNVICWHLPTESPRCFKHDGVGVATFPTSANEGGGSY